DVLLVQTRKVGHDDDVVLRLVGVHRRSPNALHTTPDLAPSTEESIKQPVHFALDVAEIAGEIHGLATMTESNHCHDTCRPFWPVGPIKLPSESRPVPLPLIEKEC